MKTELCSCSSRNLNSTWGFHRPPMLPERAAASCPKAATEMLKAREQSNEPRRRWNTQHNMGMFSSYHGVQTWSTNDRVVDFYRQYI